MASKYDFIVVGGGPAGSTVAYELATSPKRPSVLLLEAGGSNESHNLRVDGQRWLTFLNKDMNWGYKTVPQEHCDGRELDYSRGHGLGGSSAINFGVWTVGASGDYDEWARLVGDDHYNWEHIQARLKRLESFHVTVPDGTDKRYTAPHVSDHGVNGPLQVGYAAEWEADLIPILDAFEKFGLPLNLDHNSGNPIGISVLISTAYKGSRSTSRDILLAAPENLTIMTSSPVQRIVLGDANRVIGVESNGKQLLAAKEVILSAGSLDTPKILMHSGIGPAEQLEKYGIPVRKAVPCIGQGMRDHAFCPLVYKRTEHSTGRAAFYGNKDLMDAALEQWKKDGTGPWAKFACECGISFFKLDKLVASPEFQALPSAEKNFLMRETVPHTEIFTHFPMHFLLPDFSPDNLSYSCLLVFLYNAQARGTVTLQSADPAVPLLFDPNFLGCDFDRRAAIESLREALRFTSSESYAKDTIGALTAPASDSDEDLLKYWRQTISSSWHMTGTVKMGKRGETDAAVDSDFRLMGFEGLRIADMSVVPVLANCHVQAVAYLTGASCADKLIKEYDLA